MVYSISQILPIVLFPFLGFVINAFIGKRLPRKGDWLSVLAIFISFIYSFRIFLDFFSNKYSSSFYVHKVFTWIDLSYAGIEQLTKNNINMGIYIDNMGAVMLLMVSGVAFLIHLFSTFYMHDDPKYGKFFVFLGLFTSAMLGLVLSDNLLSMFIFWELMGFCSYSLIGFYHEKEKAGEASIKAFMTTRVGDVCFLLGIVAIWYAIGSVGIVDIYKALDAGSLNASVKILGLNINLMTFAALMIFMGTIGKSAQFPLQVWLPDAMMGPTPCSALIHAATMVAAGVYLSLRMYPLMDAGGITTFIAVIGAITAFGAATIALIQRDIKAVLAYSTISQLGYMVLGIGVGAYNPAFMHLITHAIFKACLFLSAGSVIHSLHDHHTHEHVQDMFRMGGLRKKLPFTFLAMLACTLAISGVPFFSGFVSKDRILGDALLWGLSKGGVHFIVPILGFGAAALTAFYMSRMMLLTFFGDPKDKDVYHHCHEEHLSINRNIPLLILAVFTLGVFYCGSLTGQGIVKVFPSSKYEWFSTLITKPHLAEFKNHSAVNISADINSGPVTRSEYDEKHGLSDAEFHHVHHVHQYGAVLSIILATLGILFAFLVYNRKVFDASKIKAFFEKYYGVLENKYFFDFVYIEVVIKKLLLPFNRILAFFDLGFYDRFAIDGWETINRKIYKTSRWFDEVIVDTIGVDGSGASVKLMNVILRLVHSGKVQFYFIVIIFFLVLFVLKLKALVF